MQIEKIDALEKIKKLKDNSQDIIFADPPYALGSTVYIDTDGKPKYKVKVDFMNKWKLPDEKFWEEFFIECNRVLKFGGRILFFGIDRQLMLFQYYAIAAKLEIKQSLYWYFMSSFPKATDTSKNIDKRLKSKRNNIELVKKSELQYRYTGSQVKYKSEFSRSSSNSKLGNKYEGTKYSIAPLKQVLETIMVFQKCTKTGSTLDDIFAYENGDTTISPSLWNIEDTRVPYVSNLDALMSKNNFTASRKNSKTYDIDSSSTYSLGIKKNTSLYNQKGRYPSQLYVDNESAEVLDNQSGILTSGARKTSYTRNGSNPNDTYGKFNKISMDNCESDSGGCSRSLHQIGYLDSELDLVIFSSKVSSQERNIGLEKDLEIGINNHSNPISIKSTQINTSTGKIRNAKSSTKNNHPTLKPIKLIYQIAKLLKTPNKQIVFFPFSGSGSEIIGFIKAGFDKKLFQCSEISQEYINIAELRIKYWENVDIETYIKSKELKANNAPEIEEW